MTLLLVLDNGIIESPRPVPSNASAKAESVLGTICDWSLELEMLAHYFREVKLVFDLSCWYPRQSYLPLAMMRRSVSSFLGSVLVEWRQCPLGLICEENFKALLPKRAGKDIIRCQEELPVGF